MIGDPAAHAAKYYEHGADELIYMDIVASLYARDHLIEIIHKTARDVFIPITAGGGIRSIDDVRALLRAGADKIAVNTAAIKRPALISEIANRFGSQCMVLSIEAKRSGKNKWEALTDNGREHSHLDAVEWAKKASGLGAGEILLTSVDQEGTRRGFDVELVAAVSAAVSIPVIASGGMGATDHLIQAVREGKADAVAMADVLHYNRMTMEQIRAAAVAAGLTGRKL